MSFSIQSVALVVESDPLTREALHDILEMAGLRVLSVAGGKEALKLFQTHSQEISLILLDRNVSDIDTLTLLHLLQQIATLPIVILSFDEQAGVTLQPVEAHFSIFDLKKPYNAEVLLATIRRALGITPR